MAALHRIANLAYTRLRFASLGRLQPKTCPVRPRPRWVIAIGPISLRPGQAAPIHLRGGHFCRRRLHYQSL